MTITTTLLMDKPRLEVIPKTFEADTLNITKVEELDIFFNVTRQDIEEEEEIYNLNH